MLEPLLHAAIGKAKSNFDSEYYVHMGVIDGRPICAKIQWEPGVYVDSDDDARVGEYGLTAGVFEENSALFMQDWIPIGHTCPISGAEIRAISDYLCRVYAEQERLGFYKRKE